MSERDDDPAHRLTGRDEELLARARAQVEREVDALDPDTRRRLTTARQAALEALAPRRAAPQAWLPVGAAAAVAVVAVGVGLALRAPAPGSTAPAQGAAVGLATGPALAGDGAQELEMLLGEDDLSLYAEDPEFYDWATEAAAGAADAS